MFADNKKNNAKEQKYPEMSTRELQEAVVGYRKQMPDLYSNLLRKERETINKNLKETKFDFDSKANVEIKPIPKSFQNIIIDTSQFQKNESKVCSKFIYLHCHSFCLYTI